MKKMLLRLGALFVVTVLIVTAPATLTAQVSPAAIPAKSAGVPNSALDNQHGNGPEQLSQAELLKSYLQMREQLQATQLAIATSRIEAEVTARAQAAALTEKLDGIKTAMDAEREHRRIDAERSQAQFSNAQREQAELQRSNHVVLWIAAVFGGLAFVAIIVGPLLQWRAINRLAHVAASRPQLSGATSPALLVGENNGLNDQTVTVSNQRMQGVIERLERRIFELEHTAGRPGPSGAVATTTTAISAEIPRRITSSNDNATRIKQLLAKGQSLLAAGKAREAVACYNEVLKLDLHHPEALVKQGAALERLKQDDEAIQCYDRAIKADARMTLAYLYKGGVCNRLERFEEASKCYEQALQTEDEKRVAAYVEI